MLLNESEILGVVEENLIHTGLFKYSSHGGDFALPPILGSLHTFRHHHQVPNFEFRCHLSPLLHVTVTSLSSAAAISGRHMPL